MSAVIRISKMQFCPRRRGLSAKPTGGGLRHVKICLIDETGAGDGALSVLAARWGLEQDDDNLMALVLTAEHLELRKRDEPKLGGIFVDFVGGAMAHRRKFGGGRGEAVAKAVGIKGDYLPDVVDATAGLGRDAFVLASVGCRVRMLERNPVVAALLDDGLARGYADAEIGGWLQERLQLIHASSLTALTAEKFMQALLMIC